MKDIIYFYVLVSVLVSVLVFFMGVLSSTIIHYDNHCEYWDSPGEYVFPAFHVGCWFGGYK